MSDEPASSRIQFSDEQMAKLVEARVVLDQIAPSGFEARVWRDREGVRINGSMEVLSFYSQDLYKQQQQDFVSAVSTVLNIVQEADLTASRAETAALQARVSELTAALETIRSGALAVVGASEAYGETENVHLWQEMADTAESALWAADSGSQEGQGDG